MAKEVYDELYTKHGANMHSDPARFLALAGLCKGRVLDIGCGTGDLADFYKEGYVGIDISSVGIEMAKQQTRLNSEFLVLNAEESVFDPAVCFDTIVMAEFLEHIKDDTKVFENIKRWAKVDARIIISVPNGDRIPDPDHKREFTVPQLRKRFSKLGKVRFHNFDGFEGRIMMTIDLEKKNEKNIALVMMCNNEELGLERAILSVIDFVDEIVIAVDSKSDDNTLEIAKRYADVVKELIWEDDFGKARNFTKEGVESKWILSLDGHEYVEGFEGIEEALNWNADGLLVKVQMEGGDSFYTNRIFLSKLSWKFAIHNAVKCENMKKFKGLVIIHDRTGGQAPSAIIKRRKQRDEMMERLLKKELKDKRKSARALFYLARWYLVQKKFKKAIRYYKKYLKGIGHVGEMWYCATQVSMLALCLNKPLLSLRYLRVAEKHVPNRWEISKLMGITYMSYEQWLPAITALVDSFKINTGDFAFYPMTRDDADTWDKIGYCWFQLKSFTKAKIAWEEAIKKDEDQERVKLNQRRIELIDKKLIF